MDSSSNSQSTPSKEEQQQLSKELDKYDKRLLKEAIISLVSQDGSLMSKFREIFTMSAPPSLSRRNSQPSFKANDPPRKSANDRKVFQRRNSVTNLSSNFSKTDIAKRIQLYSNGGKGSGIAMMVPKTWDLLLDEAGQKLRYGQAVTKIYDYTTGNQITQLDELHSGMKIIGIPDNQKFRHPFDPTSESRHKRRASTNDLTRSSETKTPSKKPAKQAWAPKSPRTMEPSKSASKLSSNDLPVFIRTVSPPLSKSAVPAKSVSPAPAKQASVKSVSPAPAKAVSPTPTNNTKKISPSPAPSTKRASPNPVKSVSPAPGKSVAETSVRKEPIAEPKKEENQPKQEVPEVKKEEPKKEEQKIIPEVKKEEPVPAPEVKKEEPKKVETEIKKEESKPVIEIKKEVIPEIKKEESKPVIEIKKEEPKEVKKEVEPIISPRKEEVPKIQVPENKVAETPAIQIVSPRQSKADQEVASVTKGASEPPKLQQAVKKSESTDSLSATSPVSATSPARVLSPQEKEAEIKRSIEDRIMERVRMMKQTKQ